eukprot:jgi/Mesvir1/24847/Mv22083-RA.1
MLSSVLSGISEVADYLKKQLAVRVLIPQWAKASLPPAGQSLNFQVLPGSGLSGPVTIYKDTWGVPHITATTWADLFFAQGFMHAQDRLWQMETLRRVSCGLISEMRGPAAIPVDHLARVMGWARLAQGDYEHIQQCAAAEAAARDAANASKDAPQAPVREDELGGCELDLLLMESYCKGVNAFVDQHCAALPWEFRAAQVVPARWTPVCVLGVMRFTCFQMAFGFQNKILRQQLVEMLGPEMDID